MEVTTPDGSETNFPCFSSCLWHPVAGFPATLDLFGDGSIRIVDAPGYLPGHTSLLCRVSDNRYVYLAGDACHDHRLLTGQKLVAEWTDPNRPGIICCIHSDRPKAEETMRLIRQLELGEEKELGNVEVIFAHDLDWEIEARKALRFWPGAL